MPVMSIQDAITRYNAIVEFTRKVMKPGKDYGVVPGTGTKPTLLKPGAEKLCSLFGLAPEFIVTDKIIDFDSGLFYFEYRCDLYHNGVKVASGIGSCNSREKKYRYRNIPERQASPEDKARAVRVEEKSGMRGSYRVYVVENPEPFDLVNTISKMAQKRAMIAAVLIAANASEFFTQDLDDLGYIDGDYRDADETPPDSRPRPPAPPAPQSETRPYPPDVVRAKIEMAAKKAEERGSAPSDSARNMIAVNLEACFAGDPGAEAKRHAVLRYLTGHESVKDLTPWQAVAMSRWLNAQPDSGGQWLPDTMAVREAQSVYAAMIEGGPQQPAQS